MRAINEITAEMAALGRPVARFYPPSALNASRAALAEWREKHPDKAAKFNELGDELREAEAVLAEQEAATRRLQRMMELLERSGVGERSLHAATDPHDWDAVVETRRWLATGTQTWLVLVGGKGTGKSVAATWAVREACKRGDSAFFRRASEVARLSTFDAGADELTRLRKCALLVVDDLGTENLTAHAQGLFFEIFDVRHENHLRTIITSNVGRQQLKERLGERLTDRLKSDGRIIELHGESKRTAKVPEPAPSAPT